MSKQALLLWVRRRDSGGNHIVRVLSLIDVSPSTIHSTLDMVSRRFNNVEDVHVVFLQRLPLVMQAVKARADAVHLSLTKKQPSDGVSLASMHKSVDPGAESALM